MRFATEYIAQFRQLGRDPTDVEYKIISEESGAFVAASVWIYFDSMNSLFRLMYDHGRGD